MRLLKSDRSPLSKKQVGELEALESKLVDVVKETAEEEISGDYINNVADVLFKKIVKMLPIRKDLARETLVKLITRDRTNSVINRAKAKLRNEALFIAEPEPIKYPFTVFDEDNMPCLMIAGNVPEETLEKFKTVELQKNKTRVRNGHYKWKMIDAAVG